MSMPREARRIFWMVRALVALGLATIIGIVGLAGWQLGTFRAERSKLQIEQARLSQTSEDILGLANAARVEITAIFDENTAVGKTDAAASLAQMIDDLLDSTLKMLAPDVLKRLDHLTDRLEMIEKLGVEWHAHYDPVWQDIKSQRTMGQVRDLVTGLRGAVDILEGGQRLHEAIQYKRWHTAKGEEAGRLAQSILTERSGGQTPGKGDMARELTEMASLVELLGGEEQLDNLADLKDNKFTPALDRLSRNVAELIDPDSDSGVHIPRTIENLKLALFGRGYSMDDEHQTIRVGTGGLYALRQDTLLLRLERERLKSERQMVSHEIDIAVAAFVKSAQIRAEALSEEMEQVLNSSWRRMTIIGVCGSGLFLWLAWWISRAIHGQVSVIELAKSDAESGRQTALGLMKDLQKLRHDNELVLNSIGEGIHWIDRQGTIIYENPTAVRLLGWQISDLLGRPAHATMHYRRADGSEYPKNECPIYATLVTGKERRVDTEVFWRKDGTSFPVDYTTTPVRNENGEIVGAVVVFSDITERKRAQADIAVLNTKLITTARLAGMAEVATGVLHNVGNVLNSVNVSAALVTENLHKSKLSGLTKVAELFRSHAGDLAAFAATPQGLQVPKYVGMLADCWTREQSAMLLELEALNGNIDHIKQIVTMQQTFAKVAGTTEIVQITDLLEDALRINAGSLERHRVQVTRNFATVPSLCMEKHKILQILVNLVQNAKQAMALCAPGSGMLTLETAQSGDDHVSVSVCDNGVGIPAENLKRIFAHGFSTRKDGHGFGLHSSALAAREAGGTLIAYSGGLGQGARFVLDIPIIASKEAIK